MRAMRGLAAATAVGVVLGLALVLVGVPYGRANLTAFAELYHGDVDTTGTVHVAIDCDLTTPGTQDECEFAASSSTIEVGITVANSTGVDLDIEAFNFVVRTDQTKLDPLPNLDGNLNGNPDFNEAYLTGAGWSCTPPPPTPDLNSDPSVAESLLSCWNPEFNTAPLIADTDHELLATLRYHVVSASSIPILLELQTVNVADGTLTELASCRPVNTVAGPCLDASVYFTGAGCTGGTNTNANFISNAPYYAVNDLTHAKSNDFPDACDPDIDGDGIPNHTEECCMSGPSCPGNTNFQTIPTLADSDGDRFHDLAECQLGSDPYASSSKPTVTACGPAADEDGDRLLDRIERCFYSTYSTVADSDGDGTRDGCEAVSLNTDQVVNSIDQLLLAQEIIRRMGGGTPHVNFDVNKDGNANSADQLLMAQLMIPAGQCP